MLKREIKINFKSFLIWVVSISSLLTLIFSIYPSISKSMSIDSLMENLPAELLKSFNFDLVSISTSFGWYASEGFVIITLVGALYCAILGSNIILKEESDKTIDFLYSKPVTRNKILISKIIAGLIYMILFNVSIMIITGIGFSINGDMLIKEWLLLSLSPILIQLAVFFVAAFIGTFFTKARKAMGIVLGFVMGTYVLNMVAKMSDSVSFLKYFSPFGYVDSSSILKDGSLEISAVIIVGIAVIFMALLFKRYNHKELA